MKESERIGGERGKVRTRQKDKEWRGVVKEKDQQIKSAAILERKKKIEVICFPHCD